MTTRETDQALEVLIISQGLTAPRITLAQIDALVASLSYHTYVIPGTTTTIAAAIAPGDAVVAIGSSASVSAANFREQLGRDSAIANAKAKAREKLWELEGWRLKRNLWELHDAGLLEDMLKPELLDQFGDHWPTVAVPLATAKALATCPCSRCASPAVLALPSS